MLIRKIRRRLKVFIGGIKRGWDYSQLEISVKYRADKLLPDPLSSPRIAYDYFLRIWDMSTIEIQEEVVALYLNHKMQVIGHRKLNRGNSHCSEINQKLLCAIALNCLASFVVLAHNHPSKVLTPSNSDIKITEELDEGLRMFGIGLIDHLIISKDAFVSIYTESKVWAGKRYKYDPSALVY